jgi:hypothetical protein
LDSIDGLLGGDTAIAPNLTALKIGGTVVTSTAAELNLLDGVTATTAELNYVDGVTSNVQTQLGAKANGDRNHGWRGAYGRRRSFGKSHS